MKRPILKSFLAFVLSLSLAACSGSDGSDSTDQGSQADLPKVISNGSYCTITQFKTRIMSSFGEFNGNQVSFEMTGDDGLSASINGELSGTSLEIESGTLDTPYGEVPVSGGSIEFTSDGKAAAGDLDITLGSEGMSFSIKLDQGECASSALDPSETLPSDLISANYMSLNNIGAISRFRSAAGHSFVDSFESCRSMKHYYLFKDEVSEDDRDNEPVYAPFASSVRSISRESGGVTIQIQSVAHPAIFAEIFHIDLDETIKLGSTLAAGQEIGTHYSYTTGGGNSDIAIWVERTSGYQLISQFDLMSDTVFSEFEARKAGITRADLSYLKTEADGFNYECEGEEFTSPPDNVRDYLEL